MQRVVANRPSHVRFRLEDDAGTLVSVDTSTNLAVTVKDRDGTTVASGNAASGGSTGRYQLAFSTAALGVLTATAVGTVGGASVTLTEQVRVLSGRAVPLSILRTDATLSTMDSWDFIAAVDSAEEAIEGAIRFRIAQTVDRLTIQLADPRRVIRPGPRFITAVLSATRTLPGSPTQTVIDPATVVPRNDGLELPTGASWSFLTGGYWPDGNVFQTATWSPGLYTFDLQHGVVTPDVELMKAVRILARHYASLGNPQAYPDRASKIVSAETEIWMARRGPEDYFGIPEVDAVVVALRNDLPIAQNPSF